MNALDLLKERGFVKQITFEEDLYNDIDLLTCVSQRGSHGGPCVAETTRQIEELAEFIAQYQ